VENTSESPRLLLEWLNILYLDDQDIAGLCSLNVEWTGEIMDLG
jgi:hypothetical protein